MLFSAGTQVVTRPGKSKLAGSKGTFSSWGYLGTECWSDPALELTVFVGTQVAPFWAHADLRQEIAAAVSTHCGSSACAALCMLR